MTENFLIQGKKTHIHTQEAQGVSNKRSPNRSTPTHIVIKISKVKDKERILEATMEKQLVVYNQTL